MEIKEKVGGREKSCETTCQRQHEDEMNNRYLVLLDTKSFCCSVICQWADFNSRHQSLFYSGMC